MNILKWLYNRYKSSIEMDGALIEYAMDNSKSVRSAIVLYMKLQVLLSVLLAYQVIPKHLREKK